jgi:plasmid stabilization system protein ParE
MSIFSVHWSEVATKDLERLVDFIQTESPPAARRLLDQIEKKAKSLERAPLRGRLVPELAYFELGTLVSNKIGVWFLWGFFARSIWL